MKAIHQLATFKTILEQYDFSQPLNRFLATFYRQNKQMGSTDRRIATRLIYNYFRIGKLLINEPIETRLLIAELLCNSQPNSFVNHFKPEWESVFLYALADKINYIQKLFEGFNIADIFPLHQQLPLEIDKEAFFNSFFIQPDLFIRIKKGEEKNVLKFLVANNIAHKIIDTQTIALPNGIKVDAVLTDKAVYEIQDVSSQAVGEFFKPQKWDKWWDCCAASGGKTLLLHDLEPDIKLVVSDIRESILLNLDERFKTAGLRNYQKKILDLTLNPAPYLHNYEFDGIIFDAPCTGSGTWGRTPEMLWQFEEHKIKFFSDLQRRIATQIIPYLKPGKPLIYITCSVFKQENQDQTDWLQSQFGLVLEHQEIIKGYHLKADTMFVARLVKT
ncbi:MAG: RsmB/NOP family class I SAM-dependent RNA methyltransferase [Sphingobacteriales bacterium]|nr:MAG: RsmB/NOP family class I SAM-dependent RNA methyltransferase [Sphingobacteriales bacterium]